MINWFSILPKMFKWIFKILLIVKEKGYLFFVLFVIGGFYCAVMVAERIGNEDLKSLLGLVIVFAFFIVGLLSHKLEVQIFGIQKTSSKTRLSEDAKTDTTPPIQSPEPHGVIFGKQGSNYIIKPEDLDGHVLVVGGVGSGKSSCIAIPTLRSWSESVFAIDIKGELYEKTKDHRPSIKVFNPLDENSYGYDPFFCLRTSHNPAQEARAIAQAIIPLPPDTKDPFWIESAQNIFSASILHYSAQNSNFLDTIRQIQSTAPKTLIKELCASSELQARYFVNSLADMEDRTLSSIMAELSRNIVYFVTDKNLASALSREKNITPDDLEFGSDVYINIPEHLLRQWKNLLTLIVNQFLTHFEQRSESDAKPILFLLDEFPRLGKVGTMLEGLATLRSKKIVICLIIQSLAQLDAIYGQNERKVISDTCAFKAILGASDADTQEYFSRLVGTYDKLVTSHGMSKGAFSLINQNTSTNTSEQEKRIIKPHEFGMLNDIVLLTPFPMLFKTSDGNIRKSREVTTANLMRSFWVPLKERDPIAYQKKMEEKALKGEPTAKTPKAESTAKAIKTAETILDKHFSAVNELIEDFSPNSSQPSEQIYASFCRVEKAPYYEDE